MNAPQILTALEHERELLREFYALSEKQLVLMDDEDLDAVNQLLDKRSDLMLELSAVEATLGTWIDQIRTDPSISTAMLSEFRCINDDIVALANQVVDIDEQTHWRLDLIKEQAGNHLRGVNSGARAMRGYARAGGSGNPSMQLLS